MFVLLKICLQVLLIKALIFSVSLCAVDVDIYLLRILDKIADELLGEPQITRIPSKTCLLFPFFLVFFGNFQGLSFLELDVLVVVSLDFLILFDIRYK